MAKVKGVCVNAEGCSKALSGEIQIVDNFKYICSECNKPLKEVVDIPTQQPKKRGRRSNFMLFSIIILGAAVVVVSYNIISSLSEGDKTVDLDIESITNRAMDGLKRGGEQISSIFGESEEKRAMRDSINRAEREIARADSIKKANIEAFKVADNIFSGELKNGQPHGTGRLDFRKDRLIDMHDEAQRRAMSGDYIVGEWESGHLIHGRLYSADGELKATMIFGRTTNPEKDHIFNSYATKLE